MKLKIYENSIVSPLKCGTRFLDSIWNPLLIHENDLYSYCLNNKINYIVLRPPLEHFKAAIQTETIGMLIQYKTGNRFDNFRKTYIDNLAKNKNTRHWSNTFYELILKIKEKTTKNIDIIKLENLSEIVNSKLGYVIEYKKESYNFVNEEYFIDREEVFNFYKNQSPDSFKKILKLIDIQTEIYENLILHNSIKTKNTLL
jgi:hypothetical protein